MLQLQLAEIYADLTIRTAQFDAQMAKIKASMAGLRSRTINLTVNTGTASARVRALQAQINALRNSSRMNVGIGGGFGGRGGGGGAGSGLAMGLGLPMMGGPGMAAGYLAGKGIKESLSTYGDLESQLVEIRRVAGLSADEAARLKQELMGIARTQPGVSVADVFGMAGVAGKSGVAKGDIAAYVSAMAMVRNAVADMDPEKLATSMVRILKNFDLGTSSLRGFGSALTAVDNASTATADDILDVSTRLSGAAHSIGLSLQQTVALAGMAKDAGLSNEVAGSGVSQILREMANRREAYAQVAGMKLPDFEHLFRTDPMEAFLTVLRKIKAETDVIGKQDMVKSLKLRGVRTGGSLLQLSTNVDKIPGMIELANRALETEADLFDANALKSGTYLQSVQHLENTWVEFADTLGTRVGPAVQTLLGGMATGLETAKALVDPLTTAYERLTFQYEQNKAAREWAAMETPEDGETSGMATGTAPKGSNMTDANVSPFMYKMAPEFKRQADEAARLKANSDPNRSIAKPFAEAQDRFMAHLMGDPKKKGDGVLGEKLEQLKGLGGMAGNVLGQTSKNIWADLVETAKIKHEKPKFESYGSGLEAGQAMQSRLLNDDNGKEQLKTQQGILTQITDAAKSLQAIAKQAFRTPTLQ